jgi:hypothetical protein
VGGAQHIILSSLLSTTTTTAQKLARHMVKASLKRNDHWNAETNRRVTILWCQTSLRHDEPPTNLNSGRANCWAFGHSCVVVTNRLFYLQRILVLTASHSMGQPWGMPFCSSFRFTEVLQSIIFCIIDVSNLPVLSCTNLFYLLSLSNSCINYSEFSMQICRFIYIEFHALNLFDVLPLWNSCIKHSELSLHIYIYSYKLISPLEIARALLEFY